MKQEQGNIVVVIVFLIILAMLIYSSSRSEELVNYGVKTEATVVDFYRVGGKYYIKYVFYVKDKKYEGETRSAFFKCDNGIKGCIGEKFTVTYSRINPTNNEIDLKKYNKYRPTKIL